MATSYCTGSITNQLNPTRFAQKIPTCRNAGKYQDRNPEIPAAGIISNVDDENIIHCLKYFSNKPVKANAHLERFDYESSSLNKIYNNDADDDRNLPLVVRSTHCAKLSDPPPSHVARSTQEMYRGNASNDATVRKLINPPIKSKVEFITNKLKESIYESEKMKPLEHAHAPCLPKNIDPEKTTFGKVTESCGVNVAYLVNPPKSIAAIIEEENQGNKLYQKSHMSYKPGQQINRNYNWSDDYTNGTKTFGIKSTNGRDDGENVRKSLKWHFDEFCTKHPPLCNKRLDKFKKLHTYGLSKTLDRYNCTKYLPPLFTHGNASINDLHSGGDIIQNRTPGTFQKDVYKKKRGIDDALRSYLRRMKWFRVPVMKDTCMKLDRNGTGKLSKQQLKEVCRYHELPLSEIYLKCILDRFQDFDDVDLVNYEGLLNFLNVNECLQKPPQHHDELTDLMQTSEHKDLSSTAQENMKRKGFYSYFTIYNQMCNDMNKCNHPEDIPAAGTLGSKRMYSRFAELTDGSVYTVLYPPHCATKGLIEEDFFIPRSKEEIQVIFGSVDFLQQNRNLGDVWRLAQEANPRGFVSVESFRNLLSKISIEN